MVSNFTCNTHACVPKFTHTYSLFWLFSLICFYLFQFCLRQRKNMIWYFSTRCPVWINAWYEDQRKNTLKYENKPQGSFDTSNIDFLMLRPNRNDHMRHTLTQKFNKHQYPRENGKSIRYRARIHTKRQQKNFHLLRRNAVWFNTWYKHTIEFNSFTFTIHNTTQYTFLHDLF